MRTEPLSLLRALSQCRRGCTLLVVNHKYVLSEKEVDTWISATFTEGSIKIIRYCWIRVFVWKIAFFHFSGSAASFVKMPKSDPNLCQTHNCNLLHKYFTSPQQWLSRKDSTSPRTLKRLAAQATIYSIWAERNKRLHEGVMATPEPVRDVILGRRNGKNFMNLMFCWSRHE